LIATYRAISDDKSVYHEPERFNPDRFLDPRVPAAPAFGFRRRQVVLLIVQVKLFETLFRSCPGIHLAESTLFIMIASFPAPFDIRPAKDDDWKEVIPEVKMKPNAIVRYIIDFIFSITR
jgi:cytochrome P450